jgi:hypothetical protein
MSELRLDLCQQFETRSPQSVFETLAKISSDKNLSGFDVYGDGSAVLNEFEQEVADLFGKDSAVFYLTGTLAQQIAFDVHCSEAGNSIVLTHPTAHPVHLTSLENGQIQQQNFGSLSSQNLPRVKVVPTGEFKIPLRFSDIQATCSRLAAEGQVSVHACEILRQFLRACGQL